MQIHHLPPALRTEDSEVEDGRGECALRLWWCNY